MPIIGSFGAASGRGFGQGGVGALIQATGGTITYDGDFAIHTFTSSGSLVVEKVAGSSPGVVDYLVVAGAGGTNSYGGGSGAGGFRFYADTTVNPQAGPGAPLNNYPSGTSVTISATTYPITVGAGAGRNPSPPSKSEPGNPSVFSTITSAGGGAAPYLTPSLPGAGEPGGSGGGGVGMVPSPGGNGNTPPTSPPQGNNGGPGDTQGAHGEKGGGGGGAIAAGASFPTGNGGAGAGITGFGTSGEPSGGQYYFSGGGAGSCEFNRPGTCIGGIGGGGDGRISNYPSPGELQAGEDGAANTGGGAGAMSKTGGSGIVVIRYQYK